MVSSKESLKSLIDEAFALEEARTLEAALRKWKEIRAVGDTPSAALHHGHLANKLKLWDEAEGAALAGVQLDPANRKGKLAWLYCLVGQTQLERNRADGGKENLARAQDYFCKAIEVEERPEFYVYLGVTYMRTGENSLAEQNLRKALKLDPSYDEAMYNLAEMLRPSAPDEAVKLYRKSLEIDPNYAAAYRGLAFVFYDTEQFEEAEDYAQRALKLDRGDWAAHTILGRILRRKKNFKAAKAELQRGAEFGMQWYEAQAALASFYDDRGNFHEAAEAYRKCLALEPDNVWANRRYGAVLADMGGAAQARVFFKRALALDPQDEKSKAYLDKLSRLYPHRQLRKRRTPRRTQR
jgi:tetratricopeptide (TPR) repeat protein